MKHQYQQVSGAGGFWDIPVVRLDSAAIRVPVVLNESRFSPKNHKQVFRIKALKTDSCARR